MEFFRKKSFASVKESGASGGLSRNMGALDLILFGLGAIIGTGVFVLTGLVAANYSGPAVTISYAVAGATCIFVGLAYAELATMLPTSGSLYAYSYVAFGEIFAWLIGSVIILELGFGSATVGAGWSGYVQMLCSSAGFPIPKWLGAPPAAGGVINLPAVFIVCVTGFVLYLGTKESKKLNALLVFIKIAAIFVFIYSAVPHFDSSNWSDFMPFGWDGALLGASNLFFAFTGFGTIASAAEETKNPKRDITIGIVGSILISVILYVIVSGLATGIAPYSKLNTTEALSYALDLNGSKVGSAIVATGAVCGMATVIMSQIYGQSRIYYVMARDGVAPGLFAKLHPKYDSPHMAVLFFTLFAAAIAGFFPAKVLSELSNMGSLIDYFFVSLIVMVFRFTAKNDPRPFKCPGLFFIAPVALVSCLILLFNFIVKDGKLLITGELIIYWFAFMFVLYFLRYLYIKKKTIEG